MTKATYQVTPKDLPEFYAFAVDGVVMTAPIEWMVGMTVYRFINACKEQQWPCVKLGDDDLIVIQPSPNKETIEHPAHYNLHPSGIECLEIVRHYNFNLGNVIKYVWRCGLKDNTTDLEDLKKARFYLDDEIKRLGGESDGSLNKFDRG